jgi:predicted lipid-binding transport protein (Tim44 family)
VSDQENILRDASGKILSGEEGKIEEISDLWTFSRDTKAAAPEWQLIETRS